MLITNTERNFQDRNVKEEKNSIIEIQGFEIIYKGRFTSFFIS